MDSDETTRPVTGGVGRGMFARMFGSALASQIVLSGVSFLVGLLLIRHTSDAQYGLFIVAAGVIALACSLQAAFIAPAMVNRMVRLGRVECGDLTGGLYREQRTVVAGLAGMALVVTLGLWILQRLDGDTTLLVMAVIVATTLSLRREFFRMVLLGYRRAQRVLRGDLLYAACLVAAIALATRGPAPAAFAILAMALASGIAGEWLARALRHVEAWSIEGSPGILRAIAPLGAWSTAGAAIHWSFSQGYTILVAATLDVRAVAAVAATRLLVMPVNLISAGIGSLMMPLSARWLAEHGASPLLRRLAWTAAGIAVVSLCYFAVLWVIRDWVFAVVLRKDFEHRDALLALWSATLLVMAVNQQLLYLLVARERFRRLTGLGAISAVLALACSWWGMQMFGSAGAPLGILVGEVVQTCGIVALCLRETRISEVSLCGTANRPLAAVDG